MSVRLGVCIRVTWKGLLMDHPTHAPATSLVHASCVSGDLEGGDGGVVGADVLVVDGQQPRAVQPRLHPGYASGEVSR